MLRELGGERGTVESLGILKVSPPQCGTETQNTRPVTETQVGSCNLQLSSKVLGRLYLPAGPGCSPLVFYWAL